MEEANNDNNLSSLLLADKLPRVSQHCLKNCILGVDKRLEREFWIALTPLLRRFAAIRSTNLTVMWVGLGFMSALGLLLLGPALIHLWLKMRRRQQVIDDKRTGGGRPTSGMISRSRAPSIRSVAPSKLPSTASSQQQSSVLANRTRPAHSTFETRTALTNALIDSTTTPPAQSSTTGAALSDSFSTRPTGKQQPRAALPSSTSSNTTLPPTVPSPPPAPVSLPTPSTVPQIGTTLPINYSETLERMEAASAQTEANASANKYVGGSTTRSKSRSGSSRRRK